MSVFNMHCPFRMFSLVKTSLFISEKECDLDKHCGVMDPERKKLCTRLLTCNVSIYSIYRNKYANIKFDWFRTEALNFVWYFYVISSPADPFHPSAPAGGREAETLRPACNGAEDELKASRAPPFAQRGSWWRLSPPWDPCVSDWASALQMPNN